MKRVAAFLKLFNESRNGNLIRCLENCKQWSQAIFAYDDGSFDDSDEIYERYGVTVIYGKKNDFANEICQKAELLQRVLEWDPDWIGWIDGDSTFDVEITQNMQKALQYLESAKHDAASVHHYNLWRHPAFYRLDNGYNDLNCVCLWKNNGKLSFPQSRGLHLDQAPLGIESIIQIPGSILHYGFASKRGIARKYLVYKMHGQTGWALDRLIDESRADIRKMPLDMYPPELIPVDYESPDFQIDDLSFLKEYNPTTAEECYRISESL